jgi:hypothetical protein
MPWLVSSRSSSAVGDLPATRDRCLEPEAAPSVRMLGVNVAPHPLEHVIGTGSLLRGTAAAPVSRSAHDLPPSSDVAPASDVDIVAATIASTCAACTMNSCSAVACSWRIAWRTTS